MTKNKARKERFERIGAALRGIYSEAAWRDRQEMHDFELKPSPLDSPLVTARTAGGPTMKTLQYTRGIRGARGLSLLADRLHEALDVELAQAKK